VTDGLSRATLGGKGKPDKSDTRKIGRPGGEMKVVKASVATLSLEPRKTKRILRSGAGRLGFETFTICVQGRTKKILKWDTQKS